MTKPTEMMNDADWSLIPRLCRDGLRQYIESGVPVGSFLSSVICNNLRASFMCADEENLPRIGDYVEFLYRYAPDSCWGSPEAYKSWIERGGLNGEPS